MFTAYEAPYVARKGVELHAGQRGFEPASVNVLGSLERAHGGWRDFDEPHQAPR